MFQGLSLSTFSNSEKNNFRGKNLGFVFQDFFLFPEFSVQDNVQMTLDIQNTTQRDSQVNSEKISNILESVGLSEKKNHLPSQLSGGQRQRVAIARALVGSPRLLLADEPTGSLDQKTGEKVIDLLFKLVKKEGMGFWCVTHDENLSKNFDIILNVEDGKIQKIERNS